MRSLALGLVVLAACADTPPPAAPQPPPPPAPTTSAAPSAPAPEKMTADTPRTTNDGNTFVAPAGWTVVTRGQATILDAPEGDSHIALVDVKAATPDEAVAAAWAAYLPAMKWPLLVATDAPDKDGWTRRRNYAYQTSPDEKREVQVDTYFANGGWTVAMLDMSTAVREKRLAAVSTVYGRLLPKGFTRESFAGKPAAKLDAQRLAALKAWIEKAVGDLHLAGASVGIVQDGKTVFAEGFGVRELGKKDKPDADTLYMIASNTKAMSTLLLAKLVDEKKLAWDTPVTEVLPSFKLGDEATTKQVQVRHLVCACTGLPRQDYEWLFEFKNATPESTMGTLAGMQPTSKFGEMFQYSNLLAAAGGFVGGHVLHPKMELGAAYDSAMQSQVFGPLGMKATTFDFKKALASNHATAHAPSYDGVQQKAEMAPDWAIVSARPAGGAWSNVRDVLSYVSMELAEGTLPNGKRYIGKEALLERRKPQVTIGKDTTYGMGLEVNTKYGIPLVSHGGSLIGYYSDMFWLPEHGIGGVILTNGQPGWILHSQIERKLLEILFDGRPEADAAITAGAKKFYDEIAADRKLVTLPADPAEAAKLAKRYANPQLGEIAVTTGAKTIFDFGEWKSEMATRKNPDGTVTFVTAAPGIIGFEINVGSGPKRTLVMRDAQHEYVFAEQ